ncbi:MAG TPA: AAA family ATPase, partial [Dongiaceae bacterium]|nr:AAA family ATPase [Dongiaceae bacterium]
MLLKTKLFAPPIRRNAVPRPHLLAHLGQPAPAQLTLIHAPAGYGKTTLARLWLDQLPNASAWLSLDAQDNDPVRFWRYVAGALGFPAGNESALNEPDQSIVALLNHWCLRDEIHPTILVLDDFHVIQDRELLTSVSGFLDRLPSSLHILITSRTLPDLHIPLRRVRDTVTELKAGALSFDPSEVRLFFQDTLQLSLAAGTLNALQEKTEGWAAALQLAGLSLKQQPVQAPDWLERSSPNLLVDYLAEEVLASLDEPLQQFLLRLALVRRFSLDLCRYLAPQPEASAVQSHLETLRDHNLFLIPLDERGHWFRLHDLFRENLLNIAHQRLQQPLPALYRQAAAWFSANHDHEEAIHCLLGGELWSEAADLIEELGVTRMLAGQNESLNWWLSRLPVEIVRWRPRLALIQAWNLFCTERVFEAEPYLDQADQQLTLEQPQYRALKAQIAIFRGQLARFRGDEDGMRFWSEQVQELSNSSDTPLNAVTRFALGMELYQAGKHLASQQILEQANAAALREHNHFCLLSTSAMLAFMQYHQGLPRKALD